ncbi:Hypothetical predicted protein [Paramuricea clavata]|uniref:Uncharacterized protein n=1 Tax=Paramuricea clavata TaxID=317549 RepID=A0A7D9DWV6_PARCT|nr:Hypothetical predicted protein [Paramuricea clavata]
MATGESKPKPEFDHDLLSGVEDQLTDKEKKGHYEKMISYILSTVKAGCSITKVFDGLTALEKMKNHVGVMDTPDFGPHIDLMELNTASAESEAEKIKTQILNVFKDKQREASDNLIINMAKANAIATTVQFVKIYFAWKTISAASNVIEDKNKFVQINKNLQRMETMVMELMEICETQPEDKSINRRMTKINSLFTSTISKISDITVKINGHIQRLDVVIDYAAVDVVSNSITALRQAYKLWSVFENLSSPSKWLGALSVAMYGVFGVANAAVFVISRDRLKELQKDLREVVYLRKTLDDLHQQAEDAIMDC